MHRAATIAGTVAVLSASAAFAGGLGYTITLQEARIVDGHVTTGAGRELKVESFQWGSAAYGGHGMLGASDRAVVGGAQVPAATHDIPPPRDGGLGSESERTFVVPHVLERGTLTVTGSLAGCTVGKRYAGAQFAAGAMRYELRDVVISNCAANGVSLEYAKVRVRGWDPAKKEQ